MGVDALMRVDMKTRITDQELARLNYRACRALGRDFFHLYDNDMPLSRISAPQKEDAENGDDNADGWGWPYDPIGDVLHVSVFWHHYGKGYERGPGHKIILLARYLERVTGGVVWYGNDSDGHFSVFGESEQQQMWALFCHDEPYVPDFGHYPCEHCGGMPMHMYTVSRQYMMGGCPGCARHVVTGTGEFKPQIFASEAEARKVFDEIIKQKADG